MITVSHFIANYLAAAGVQQVFMVTGGGSMYLNDALAKHPRLNVLFNHHEQACAMAAESYARLSNQLAVVNVTTGPGGLNAVNGVFGAWTDSIPMLVLSGQVKYETTVRSTGLPLRQMGDQECDIVSVVASMTKYAVMVTDPITIKWQLEKALYLATHGRPGPVWLDIPINIQSARIDATSLLSYEPLRDNAVCHPVMNQEALHTLFAALQKAVRPVILAGTGVRLSKQYTNFLTLVNALRIPVTTAFNAHDLLPNDHPYYAGRPGTVGERAGNFVVQNADVLLVLGCRLNVRQISYNPEHFAREAYIIMVDIDAAELKKPSLAIDLPIHADLAEVIPCLIKASATHALPDYSTWLAWCKQRMAQYPTVLPSYWDRVDGVNPYCFIEALSEALPEDAVIVTANATACITAFQAFKLKKGQRLYSNSGSASMGYDIPAAIGACLALGGHRVIGLAGDGSLQQNSQELATIRCHQLPIVLFVLNNQGYQSIRQTQSTYFSEPLIGVSANSGLYFPDMEKIADAYDIPYRRCTDHQGMRHAIRMALRLTGPVICEVMITPEQPFAPKLSARQLEDGRMVSSPLEDMAPFLSREELRANMIIDLVKD